MEPGTAHRRSLLSFSSLSAQDLAEQHKACDAATKEQPYEYTQSRCARTSPDFIYTRYELLIPPGPPLPPPRLPDSLASRVGLSAPRLAESIRALLATSNICPGVALLM